MSRRAPSIFANGAMSSRPQGDQPVDLNSVLSVAEFNRRVARLLERSVPLVWVAGEVSNLTRAASGHWYFSLKDADAQVRCVMFRNANRLLDWRVKDGEQVEVRAVAGLYAPRGEFQLTVEAMRQAGAGALFEAFLKVKAKLEAEGLFAPERKRTLPSFPRTIGVVTSMQAAALRDVLTALARRSPHLRVIIYPTPVQGKEAPAKLVEAIGRASRRAAEFGEIDVLLVVRGGGSIEDLAAFNDESLARAIAAASIPVVSGVGHETDVTIADFVADLRAATPTAAAELASPDQPRLLAHLSSYSERSRRLVMRRLNHAEQRLDEVQRRLKSPEQRLAQRMAELTRLVGQLQRAQAKSLGRQREALRNAELHLRRATPDLSSLAQRLVRFQERAATGIQKEVTASASRLNVLKARLKLLDPNAALQRGYAIVEHANGKIVDDAGQLAAGDVLELRFRQGSASAVVRSTSKTESRLK
jgi:exodeoxyribonuclease VII large subunit